ncbi:hypothetical protein SNOG_09140 [Parastagonospora nodorum SN15]|uniref:Uncharacterized protein n=1 Tax=Phaeosphaeria nodorum (strain SN15 / ATCC MYA-4574 / FGSC 10173) TaxID=321614 RepID=Q0UGH4_PHANO|nr:hypothetical protein SNOG_09140 [Parastagonospora nodorum SN15]EAT83332.1 hypothetical protein SNOG_09140 [Parastagonospora nodorum SN15]
MARAMLDDFVNASKTALETRFLPASLSQDISTSSPPPPTPILLLTKFLQLKLPHAPRHLFVLNPLPPLAPLIRRILVRLRTPPTPQTRIIPAIGRMRNAQPQQTTHTNIPHIMSIILTPGYRNQCRAQQRRQCHQHAREVSPGPVNMALPRDPQTQVSEAGETEAGVPAGEAAPPVVQHVVVRLGADFPGNKGVGGRAGGGFAARDEVGARAADGVFDHVGYEEGQEHGDEPAEEGDVRFVRRGAQEEGPEDEGGEGEGAGVDEEPYCV